MESRVSDIAEISEGVRCPDCDRVAKTVRHRHVFRYGQGESAAEIEVELPVRVCGGCGFEFVDEEGERLKHEAVCTHLGVLSPREVRDIRKRHDMTRAEFAAMTGLGEATLGRWETGVGIQSYANDRYLRLLAQTDGMSRLSSLLRSMRSTDEVRAAGQSGELRSRFRLLQVTGEVRQAQSSFELVIVSKAA